MENDPSSLPDASIQLARLVKKINNINQDTQKIPVGYRGSIKDV